MDERDGVGYSRLLFADELLWLIRVRDELLTEEEDLRPAPEFAAA